MIWPNLLHNLIHSKETFADFVCKYCINWTTWPITFFVVLALRKQINCNYYSISLISESFFYFSNLFSRKHCLLPPSLHYLFILLLFFFMHFYWLLENLSDNMVTSNKSTPVVSLQVTSLEDKSFRGHFRC